MKTYTFGDQTYEVPDIEVTAADTTYVMRITEGEFTGTSFSLSNIRMDDTDEGLMWYDIDVTNSENQPIPVVDGIKKIADNFILIALHEQVEKHKHENTPTE